MMYGYKKKQMTIKLFNRDKKTDAKNIEKYSTLQPTDKELQRLLKIKRCFG